jgi:hypothetical protein
MIQLLLELGLYLRRTLGKRQRDFELTGGGVHNHRDPSPNA